MIGFFRLLPVAGVMLSPTQSAGSAVRVRAALDRAIPLIEKSIAEYPKHSTCFSCHHQGATAIAFSVARDHGCSVKLESFSSLSVLTEDDLRGAEHEYAVGNGQPGGVERAGWALWTLQLAGTQRNQTTDAVVGFLLGRDRGKGGWRTGANRPPSELSSLMTTFVALRALRSFAPSGSRPVDERIAAARDWLLKETAKDTEDRVFRLYSLKEAGASEGAVAEAARDLLGTQRADGGWAQTDTMQSDAYATGSALTALAQAGGLAPSDARYLRGVQYLVDSQLADGSWHVVSRSKPFQPYFESGFPHGKDQFISMAASSWAVAALALTLPAR